MRMSFAFLLLASVAAVPAAAQMPAPDAPPAKVTSAPDVTARNEIIYRANLGRADDVELLIKQGGSPNQASSEGVPILSLAAARRDAEGINVVKRLIKLGANINGRDSKGQTALFAAAKQGNIDVVNLLLVSKIDPLALDNNGDIARTVAFASGHKDVVLAMDAFATKPAEPETTDDHQKTMENKIEEMKNNPLSVDEMKRIQNELAETNKKSMTAETSASQKTSVPADSEEPDAAQLQQEQDRLGYDIAFNSCGFQYWSYCTQVKQSTELESEELSVATLAYKAKTDAIKNDLVKTGRLNVKAYNAIVTSAQQRIFNQLNMMYSNQERHEKGVGRMDDMMTRCQEIGRQWAISPPGIEKKQKDSGDNSKSKGSQKNNTQNSGPANAPNSNGSGSYNNKHAAPGQSGNSGGGGASNGGGGSSGSAARNNSVEPPLQEFPENSLFK